MEAGEGFVAQLPVLNALSSPFPHLLLLIQHGLLIILATLLHGGLPLCLVLRNQNEGHLVPDARDPVETEGCFSSSNLSFTTFAPEHTPVHVHLCVLTEAHSTHAQRAHIHTCTQYI